MFVEVQHVIAERSGAALWERYDVYLKATIDGAEKEERKQPSGYSARSLEQSDA